MPMPRFNSLRPVHVLISLLILRGAVRGAEPATRPAIDQATHQMLQDWQERLEQEHLKFVVAAPFVIAGDGSRAKLARYRDGTIVAAARALHATYFKTEPSEPILILLFESAEPYNRVARKWFSQTSIPHFGFYKPRDRAMVMNVSTGTGTLVHELTHALLAPDFPAVPSWFNEGLASLYEQCSLGENTITGHENWRLPSLQKAIRDKTLRPLSEMIGDADFYRTDMVGINYAQARYLMFYLQEKGLLRDYYRKFRDHHDDDPTGLESLKTIVAPQEIGPFETEWRAWVLTLHFN